MRVLLAGATGAIGRPLARALRDAGHEVVGLTRDTAKAGELVASGVEPIVADALDRDQLLHAASGLRFEAVVHQMTALSKAPARHSSMEATNMLRTVGTHNLLALAREAGVRRFVTQSIVFGYGYVDHGEVLLTEKTPFGTLRGLPTDRHVTSMRINEEAVVGADEMEGVALRYGLLYGADDVTTEMVRRRKVPVPRPSRRRLAWVHVDDAVSATVTALEHGRAGVYNVVDDTPASWEDVLTALAASVGAPAPRVMPDWLFRLGAPYVAAMLGTSMHVSNQKARAELGWSPVHASFRDGLAALAR